MRLAARRQHQKAPSAQAAPRQDVAAGERGRARDGGLRVAAGRAAQHCQRLEPRRRRLVVEARGLIRARQRAQRGLARGLCLRAGV